MNKRLSQWYYYLFISIFLLRCIFESVNNCKNKFTTMQNPYPKIVKEKKKDVNNCKITDKRGTEARVPFFADSKENFISEDFQIPKMVRI